MPRHIDQPPRSKWEIIFLLSLVAAGFTLFAVKDDWMGKITKALTNR